MQRLTVEEILTLDPEDFVRYWNDNSIQASCLEELGRPYSGEFDFPDLYL